MKTKTLFEKKKKKQYKIKAKCNGLVMAPAMVIKHIHKYTIGSHLIQICDQWSTNTKTGRLARTKGQFGSTGRMYVAAFQRIDRQTHKWAHLNAMHRSNLIFIYISLTYHTCVGRIVRDALVKFVIAAHRCQMINCAFESFKVSLGVVSHHITGYQQ